MLGLPVHQKIHLPLVPFPSCHNRSVKRDARPVLAVGVRERLRRRYFRQLMPQLLHHAGVEEVGVLGCRSEKTGAITTVSCQSKKNYQLRLQRVRDFHDGRCWAGWRRRKALPPDLLRFTAGANAKIETQDRQARVNDASNGGGKGRPDVTK